MIAEGAGSVLAGRPGEPALARLEGVLSRNGYPYSVLDVTDNDEGHALVERFGLHDEDLPIVLCPNGTLLGHPSDIEVAACVGITSQLDPSCIFDVAVVGAGPAGLATAVYAASEGLSVLVLAMRVRLVGRLARRHELKTISAFPPVSPVMHWLPVPSSRRRNSARRFPYR